MKRLSVLLLALAQTALACGDTPVVPGFGAVNAWRIENYQNALSIVLEQGALRIKGMGKQKDTAWTAKSAKTAIPPGTKEISVTVRTTASRNLGGGGAMDNHNSAVFWFDGSGKELAATQLRIPAIIGISRLKVTDVLAVPAEAKFFFVRLGFDWPDFRKQDSLELADIEILAHPKAGTLSRKIELPPDMRPVEIERKSASPFEDAFSQVVFSVSDVEGVDWSSLSVEVDGVERTSSCRRSGDDICIPAPPQGWSNGLHVAKISIDSKRAGIKACERRAFYRGATPATARVTLRDDGLALVDGKPFFPIGAYGVNYDKRMP
ncbi:MAG: hypothetical protein IKZ22_05460, partial [Kiritimatiellae bacterium]|nr:hypothetical protein [Kiritimatiellia bacterium]